MAQKNENKTNSDTYDFIIVGAGPAGMAAGVVAAREGYKSIILEKGAVPGPRPRAETVRAYPFLDTILGEGFMESIAKHSTDERLFHSPKNKFQGRTKASTKSYVFDWRDLMDGFLIQLNDLNVPILYNCEVKSPLIENKKCIGVNYVDENNSPNKIYGKTVLSCDGHQSAIGKSFNINYREFNNPIIKCQISNANTDINEHSALELFIIAQGELEYAPEFPPCALFVFPGGGKELEVGCMLFNTVIPKLKGVEIPSDERFLEVWDQLKSNYPGFSEFFMGAKIEHEEITAIPSVKMVKNVIPKPGCVLIGDSAGFVESTGSSGLYFSMHAADFWVRTIGKKMKEGNENDPWSKSNVKEFKKTYKQFETYKYIKKIYKLVHIFHWYVFKRRRTAERINEKFDFILKLLDRRNQ